MEDHRIIILFNKIQQKAATAEEQQEFDELLQDKLAEQALKTYWDQQWREVLAEDKSSWQIPKEQEILNRILSHRNSKSKKSLNYRFMAAAASILIVMAAGLFFLNQERTASPKQSKIVNIVPGRNTATLTLANGKKIKLSDAANGELANEAGVKITKSEDGEITYEIVGGNPDNDSGSGSDNWNTLSTTNGETYRVRLPDHSEIWLNAASSIKYPVNFAKQATRKVELTGEAYFEVAKDKSRPFIVHTKDQVVHVLGTHFNVNAYENEHYIKTTLVEGSVRVQRVNTGKSTIETEPQILKPGEQSLLSEQGIKVRQADIEESVAWKMGFFKFRDENIQSIMRKVSRWYNVEVVYVGEIPTSGIEGSVSRYDDINQLLDLLESTGLVKFKIRNNKIIVSK
ncbi:FecR family protein [Desertivirga xinjiangensis]|uniref:FecR family protein n=1 Tax=Desertivirga xinjiangensis TaxID=539206 RepID=UPI00210D10F3|nr:FecR domain-containing protein [Pedobacter xinjiangensis]